MAEQYVQTFLSCDAVHAPFWLNQLEVKFSHPFALSIGQNNSRIVLSGYTDRLDEKDGVHRMFDYKTGSDKPEFKTVEGLFERDGKQQNKAALQTLLYSWMFSRQFPEKIHFEPALAALRQSHGQPTDELRLIEKNGRGKLDHHQLPNVLEEVTWRLRQTLEELFDSEAPFDQTTDLKTCKYCDFKGICGR